MDEIILSNLPELQGSKKQIEWANDIRDGYLRQFEFVLNNLQYVRDTIKPSEREETIEYVKMKNRVYGAYTILDMKLLSSIDEDGFTITIYDGDKSPKENVKNILEKAKIVFENNSSAKWWIEHRTR